MKTTEYHYYQRGGEPVALPDWIHITITEDREQDEKRAYVHSRIHVIKTDRVGPIFSCAFSDGEIIKQVSGEVSRRFL